MNRSKKSDKLSDWVAQEQLQNRSLIQDELGTVAELIFGDDAGNIMHAVSDAFFDMLISDIKGCKERSDEDSLHQTVIDECLFFQANIQETLSPLFTRKQS